MLCRPHLPKVFRARQFFPISLCGGLVFGWALPRSLLLPPPAASSHTTCSHTTCSHTTSSHTTSSHTTSSHTTSSHTHTTYSHTTSSHTTYSHTTSSLTTYSHTTYTQLAHAQLVHAQLTHTQLADTQLPHTQLAHTPLVHTQLTHIQLTHAQLVHTQLVLRQLTRTQLTHTQLVLRPSLCVAGVAHGHIDLHYFAWQARLVPSGRHGRRGCCHGRRGTWRHPPSLCVAGVALADIDLHFAWQAWRLRHALDWLWWCMGPSWRRGRRGCLRGRCGAWRQWPSLCVAGVAVGDIDFHFAWQSWHLVTSMCALRGRPALDCWWRAWVPVDAVDAAAVCAAGVALGDIDLHFAWQAWHLVTSTFTLRGKRVTKCTSICALRGRCGAYGTVLDWLWWRAWVPVDAVDAAAVCVVGVALGDIDGHFAWQAWQLVTLTFTLRGRRGTWWHWPSLCVVGVALGDIDGHFAWQAWPLATLTFTLRGRQGTWWHWPSLCVVGVALGDIDGHLAWQVWHLVTSTCTLRGRCCTFGTGLALVARLGPSWRRGRRGCLRGRRGTWRHWPSLCVAGVAVGDIDLHFAWQAWHLVTSTCTLRGRRAWVPVDAVDAAAVCVAGVALGDNDVYLRGRRGTHSAWLAWHLWLWWRAWSPLDAVDAVAVCVACVELGDIDVHSAWQAWHLATSTCILRGRRGSCWHGPIYVRSAWQAWRLCHRPGSGGRLGDRKHLFRVVDFWLAWPGSYLCEARSGFAWTRQPSAFAKRLLQTVCSHHGLRALLGMVPRPAAAIHLYSWCWYAGFGYIHTSIHAYIHTCTHAHIHYITVHTCMHACIHTYIHTHIHTYITLT